MPSVEKKSLFVLERNPYFLKRFWTFFLFHPAPVTDGDGQDGMVFGRHDGWMDRWKRERKEDQREEEKRERQRWKAELGLKLLSLKAMWEIKEDERKGHGHEDAQHLRMRTEASAGAFLPHKHAQIRAWMRMRI